MFGFFVFFIKKLVHTFLQSFGFRYCSDDVKNQNNNVETLVVAKVNTKQVLWSKLDRDALGEIMSKVCAVDQARFHAVCKAFRAAHPINTPKSLPWFVSVDCSLPTQTLTVELYDPSSTPDPTSVHRISLAESGVPISTQTGITTIHKDGWLFMSIRKEGDRLKYLVVYSPLTKQLIQFPPYYSDDKLWYVGTSLVDPSSLDCIFLIVETRKVEDKVAFRTIRQGDKEWNVRGRNRADPVSSPAREFSTIHGQLKYENISVCNDFFENLEYKFWRREMFTLDGKLMYFCTNILGQGNNIFREKPCIKWYDCSKKVWIPVTSLGDQTIFVSEKCFGVAKIGKEAMDDNRILPNKIYYFFYAGCIIYSFENGDLVRFKCYPGTGDGIVTTCFEDSGNNILESKYSGIRYGDKTKAFFWFDPPVIKAK